MNVNSFYSDIKPFGDFSLLTEDSGFHRVPDSWSIILTDVRGSTKAIEEGRYKDVNLIGAASVTCVINSLAPLEIPFVFGGDGSTLLVPSSQLDLVESELCALQALSQREFGLELRVGHVSLSELRRQGADLFVGKYELSSGNCTAQFKGGALSLAEDMLKKKMSGIRLLTPSRGTPQLKGLSCRLNPLPSRRGLILSLLVKPKEARILPQLLKSLREIMNDDFRSVSPVTQNRLKWPWLPRSLFAEVKLRQGSWLSTLKDSLLAALLLKFNLSAGGFKPRKYKAELVLNSDFKKFDETLRMVIDCTEAQAEAIEALLQSLSADVDYGTHRSLKALMTCVVSSATHNRHIHFIDGADGGYALAAKQMKSRVR